MADATLSKDMALRIGLAARALPDTEPAKLLAVLAGAVGLPPAPEKLAALKVKDLKGAADEALADIPAADLKKALAYLKGEAEAEATPMPETEAYQEGDMPGSIRIACASNGAEDLDGHFGSCARFLIYQVSPEETRLIDVRPATHPEDRDKNDFRADLIKDCHVLYVVSIGGPAAAKVVRRDIHPIKFPNGGNAREVADGTRSVLTSAPPPWLAKAMGRAPEERVRFEREAGA